MTWSSIKPKLGLCPDCGDDNERPLIRNKCQYHYWLEKRKPIPRVKKPIRKVGAKMAKRLRIYYRNKADYMAKHEFCEVSGCGMPSTDCHHKQGKDGDLLTDENNFMAMCRKHHDMCKTHPKWAEENGYIISRLKIKN